MAIEYCCDITIVIVLNKRISLQQFANLKSAISPEFDMHSYLYVHTHLCVFFLNCHGDYRLQEKIEILDLLCVYICYFLYF